MTQADETQGGETPAQQWITLADVMSLERKLRSYPEIDAFLQDRNEYLAGQAKGPIALRDVALVGCVYRKNIRQNTTDPGAVPHKAMVEFSQRCDLAQRTLENLHVKAAITILEAVGFMTHTRTAQRPNNAYTSDQAKGKCSAYRLLNEGYWDSPIFPTLNGNRNPNANVDV